MSLPILPSILSALFLAGSAGAVVTAAKPGDVSSTVRSERAGKPEAKRAKARGLCAQIECTPEQKAELKALRESHKADRKADRKAEHEAMKKLRSELAAQYRKEKPDPAAMASIYQRMDTLRANRVEERREAFADTHGILDARQRDVIADRIEKGGPEHAMRGDRKGGKGKRDAKAGGKDEREAKAGGKDKRDAKAGGKGFAKREARPNAG